MVLLTFCIAAPVNAAEAAAGNRAAKRYLFVIETSKTMQRRLPQTRLAIQQLLESGLDGRMRSGDSVGVWTFDDDVHTGQLPPQKWTPANASEVANRVGDFLQTHPTGNAARLESAWMGIEQLASSSDFLGVVLVTSGAERLMGSPFDERINETFRLWTDHQTQRQMPILTYLQASQRKFAACAVAPAPWKLNFPEMPSEPPPKAVLSEKKVEPVVKPAPAFKPAAPVTAAPLIVVGRKEASTAAAPLVTAPTQAPSPQLESEPTQALPTPSTSSTLAPAPSIVGPASAATENVLSQPTMPALEPKVVTAPVTSPLNHAPEAKTAISTVQAPAPEAKPAVVPPTPDPRGTLVVNARELESRADKPAPEATVKSTDPVEAIPSAASFEVPVVQGAAVPPVSFLDNPGVRIAALVTGLAAVLLLSLMVRRSKPVPRGSLITRSLERRAG